MSKDACAERILDAVLPLLARPAERRARRGARGARAMHLPSAVRRRPSPPRRSEPDELEPGHRAGRRPRGRLRRRGARPARQPSRACVIALLSGGHVMIEDVPGVGKTVLGQEPRPRRRLRLLAPPVHGRPAARPTSPASRSGIRTRRRSSSGPARCSPTSILVDEINRASPKTQSALLECMEEGQVTVDGETRLLPQPFMIIATQNPVEYEGTFPLPEAQLDRFAVRVAIGYPAPEDEAGDAARPGRPTTPLERVVAGHRRGRHHRRAPGGGARARRSVPRALRGRRWSAATRRDPRAELGASPRAGLALLRAAKARAVLDGPRATRCPRTCARWPRRCWRTG